MSKMKIASCWLLQKWSRGGGNMAYCVKLREDLSI